MMLGESIDLEEVWIDDGDDDDEDEDEDEEYEIIRMMMLKR